MEPYEYWIAMSLGYALHSQDALERWPTIVPQAWHSVQVKVADRIAQPHAADILRTALRCHYEGVMLRAILDRVLGVGHMFKMIVFSGYSPSVKMRLDSLDVVFIGDKPPNRDRRYEYYLEPTKPAVTKASQVVDLLSDFDLLPQGWAVVPPLTCVDPFYYDAHIPRSSEEPMPDASDKGSIRWLGDTRAQGGSHRTVDHRRATQGAAEDTALEAVTSTRTTLHLLAEVVSGDYRTSTMLWIGLLWAVDESVDASAAPVSGPWMPRGAIFDTF